MEGKRIVNNTKFNEKNYLYFIGDTHLSNINCDTDFLIKTIKYIAKQSESKNVFVFLMGDLSDFISNIDDKRFDFNSVGTRYKIRDLKDFIPLQVEEIVDIFSPIKKNIVSAICGNHEEKIILKTNNNIYCGANGYCTKLKITPIGNVGMVQIQNLINNSHTRMTYTIAMSHGFGGGSHLPGSAINNCVRFYETMFGNIDLGVMGHMHKLCHTKRNYIEFTESRSADKELVNTVQVHYAVSGTYLQKSLIGTHNYFEGKPGGNTGIGCLEVAYQIHRKTIHRKETLVKNTVIRYLDSLESLNE